MSKLPRPKEFKDPNVMPAPDILQAIGRVSAVSAGIEEELHALYWKLLAVSDGVGKVITGDMRSNRMTEDILRIARASREADGIIKDLEDLFQDFKEKNQKRNQYLHWIWTNTHEIKSPSYKSSNHTIAVTAEDVNELADDLIWLEVRLASHTKSHADLLIERRKLGAEADLYAPAPWLNKPR
jgi:hypothetical protein